MPLKVLICGGGCSGPALAFWLSRLGHDVTVVEHHAAAAHHAAGGLVDVGPNGAQVLERMGLLPAVREAFVPPSGTAFVNAEGQVKGTITPAGRGGCRSRYEIARGSLVKALYGATADRARWVFGKTVEGFEEGPDGVTVSFSDGDVQRYDLLVGADGQDSLVRRGMATKAAGEGEGEEDVRVRVGVYEAYWSVPRTNDDIVSASGAAQTTTYHAPGGRVMTARTHGGAGRTQVRFLLRDDAGLAAVHAGRCSGGTQRQEFLAERFADAGWQAGRFLAGMRMADDFWCREAVVVRTQRGCGQRRVAVSGSEGGRVVLVGDAAHCSAGAEAVFAGLGGGGGGGGAGGVGLVGAYVLAGQMARTPGDLKAATEAYGVVIRPFVDEVQGWTGRGGSGVGGEKVLGTVRRCAMPMGAWGVCILRFVLAVVCFLRVPEILARLMLLLPPLDVSGGGGGGGGGGRWRMPEYLELQGEKMG